jgi:hypothetical protein
VNMTLICMAIDLREIIRDHLPFFSPVDECCMSGRDLGNSWRLSCIENFVCSALGNGGAWYPSALEKCVVLASLSAAFKDRKKADFIEYIPYSACGVETIRQDLSRASAISDALCHTLRGMDRLGVLATDIQPSEFIRSFFRDLIEARLYGKEDISQIYEVLESYLSEMYSHLHAGRDSTIIKIYNESGLREVAKGIKVEGYPLLEERTIDEYRKCRFLAGRDPTGYTIYTYFNYKLIDATTCGMDAKKVQKRVRKEWRGKDALEKEVWKERAKRIRI